MKIVEQSLEESDAYSLFLYAFRSPVTKDCYLRRMKIFFNFINFLPNGNLEESCNLFVKKGLEDHQGTLLDFYDLKKKE